MEDPASIIGTENQAFMIKQQNTNKICLDKFGVSSICDIIYIHIYIYYIIYILYNIYILLYNIYIYMCARSKPDGMIIPLGLSRRGQVMVAMVDTL